MNDDTCRWCGGTGWITRIDYDGSGYDEPCPDGCPLMATVDLDIGEVPY